MSRVFAARIELGQVQESDALDEMKRRKQSHDPARGPMFTAGQVNQLGAQLRHDAMRGTMSAMDQMQAQGNANMHPNNPMPDLSPHANQTFVQQANTIAAMNSTPVGSYMHDMAIQNQLTSSGFRPLLPPQQTSY